MNVVRAANHPSSRVFTGAKTVARTPQADPFGQWVPCTLTSATKLSAVAGPDRCFVWAEAAVVGRRVVVWSPAVPEPVAVRYAWGSNPPAPLTNGAGLPASPFRTDNWERPGLH